VDNTIQLPDTGANTGPLRQTISRTVGGQTVHSAVDCIGDATDGSLVAEVANAAPATNAAGLVTRNIPSGTQTVTGTVGLAGSVFIGSTGTNVVSVTGTVGATVTNWPASQAVSAASLPLPTGAATETTLGGVLKEGTDITGATMPAGGASGRGWLSAIWKAFTDRLPAAVTGSGNLKAAIVESTATVTVTGPLTDAQLRASAVPVSNTSLPLPTGAATSAKQPALGTAGTASTDVLTVQGIAGGVAQPISVASLPLPTGAATETTLATLNGKVTAVNTGAVVLAAGTAAFGKLAANDAVDIGDVTVNNGSGTNAVQVQDGGNSITVDNGGTFAVQAAQSGTWNITNISGTISLPTGAAADATLTGGTAKAINRGGAKGATTAADVTSTAQGADHQSLDVQLYHGTAAIDPRAITPPTLTKGTQGATGLSVQSLKDAGRSVLNFYMAAPVATAATDTAQSLTAFSGSGTVAATLTPAVIAAGKTYRIQGLSFVYQAGSAAGSVTFTLRMNTSGTASATAPALGTWTVGAVAAGFGVLNVALPDGLEIPAAAGLAVTMLGRGSNNAALAIGFGQATINGYTY
jgi:hypothetical protein